MADLEQAELWLALFREAKEQISHEIESWI